MISVALDLRSLSPPTSWDFGICILLNAPVPANLFLTLAVIAKYEIKQCCNPIYVCAVLQFGDSQKLRLVRILRSTVMVRVGGGWVALDEFLVKNDPCRGRSHQPALLLVFSAVQSLFPSSCPSSARSTLLCYEWCALCFVLSACLLSNLLSFLSCSVICCPISSFLSCLIICSCFHCPISSLFSVSCPVISSFLSCPIICLFFTVQLFVFSFLSSVVF